MWEPGIGVVHDDCFQQELNEQTHGRLAAVRDAFKKADVDVPDKYSYDIENGKQRIEEVQKRMGWPTDFA